VVGSRMAPHGDRNSRNVDDLESLHTEKMETKWVELFSESSIFHFFGGRESVGE
jgi:hypothetical protein